MPIGIIRAAFDGLYISTSETSRLEYYLVKSVGERLLYIETVLMNIPSLYLCILPHSTQPRSPSQIATVLRPANFMGWQFPPLGLP